MRKVRDIYSMRQVLDERIKLELKKNVQEHKLEEEFVGDKVNYKREDERKMRGPANLIQVDEKKNILVKHGGILRGVARVHNIKIQGEKEVDEEEEREETECNTNGVVEEMEVVLKHDEEKSVEMG